MPWFKVDDTLTHHSKVVAAGNAAMGLWVRAGAWSALHLEEGFVPRHIARTIGNDKEIRSLLKSGLWEEAEGGYHFHNWDKDGRQPSRAQVEAERAAARDRQQRARAKARGVTQTSRRDGTVTVTPPSRRDTAVTHAVTTPAVTVPPTRPDPTSPLPIETWEEEASTSTRANPPPPTCIKHPEGPDHDQPCRACKAVREWQAQRTDEEAERQRELNRQAAVYAQQAINDCPICDEYGWINYDDGTVDRCTHHLDQVRHA